MKKVIIFFSFIALFFCGVFLSSCSSEEDAPKVNLPSELSKITVKDANLKDEPKLIIDPTINLLQNVYSVIHNGEGGLIEQTDRLEVKTDTYQSINNSEYKILTSAWGDKKSLNILTMQSNSMPDGLYGQLLGKKVGTIFISFTGSQNANSGQMANYIMVNKIVGKQKGYNTAEGEEVNVDKSKPSASLAANGAFELILPEQYKRENYTPKKLDSYYLIKGNGAKIQSNDTVSVKYTGWLTNGTQFDAKIDSPFVASLKGSVIKGWTEGLKDKTIGSRVMLVVPPSLGYGNVAIGQIPPNSTLIFCIDILGVN
ncbi:MAG: FKBP-type peptidyl-prolyl cis-trans isomerase [Bifidobacteriaceae bacterium]|jgi:peptidylprolyl isomerase|nr:FKBP-type peptidyl-prolyl cis-trans isomerase [Bifidobacteriaceae bacterium]